jgi:hypothetical protein
MASVPPLSILYINSRRFLRLIQLHSPGLLDRKVFLYHAMATNEAAWLTVAEKQSMSVGEGPKAIVGPGEVVIKNAAVAIVSFPTPVFLRDLLHSRMMVY